MSKDLTQFPMEVLSSNSASGIFHHETQYRQTEQSSLAR